MSYLFRRLMREHKHSSPRNLSWGGYGQQNALSARPERNVRCHGRIGSLDTIRLTDREIDNAGLCKSEAGEKKGSRTDEAGGNLSNSLPLNGIEIRDDFAISYDEGNASCIPSTAV